jgi:hypothetical protein
MGGLAMSEKLNLIEAHVIAVQSPGWTQDQLDHTVNALLEQAEQYDFVVAARAKADAAAETVRVLECRQSSLNKTTIELNRRLDVSRDGLKHALLVSDDVADTVLHEQGAARALAEGAGQALELITAELLPDAKRELVSANVDYWYAQVKAIEAVATKRVEAIIKKLAVIVGEDCMIEFDSWSVPTVTGLLTQRNRIFDLANNGRKGLENRKG